jgi:glc operon protein GlcG
MTQSIREAARAAQALAVAGSAAALLVCMPLGAADRPHLTLADAKAVVATAVDYAQDHSAPGGTIAVVDAGGSLVYLERLDGTFPASAAVSAGKARTAALFQKPTSVFEKAVNDGRTTMVALPDITPFTPLQGGVPLVRDGVVVGAIGVSGAASAQQDEEIANAAAQFYSTRRTATTGSTQP